MGLIWPSVCCLCVDRAAKEARDAPARPVKPTVVTRRTLKIGRPGYKVRFTTLFGENSLMGISGLQAQVVR